MAANPISLKKPDFWVRELKQSQAEVDFILPWGTGLVPVEVKSGKTGTLRSLHSFIDNSGGDSSRQEPFRYADSRVLENWVEE